MTRADYSVPTQTSDDQPAQSGSFSVMLSQAVERVRSTGGGGFHTDHDFDPPQMLSDLRPMHGRKRAMLAGNASSSSGLHIDNAKRKKTDSLVIDFNGTEVQLSGFSELAKYYSGLNDWIDESNPVYSKLKEWMTGANEGAISSQTVDVSFDINGAINELRAIAESGNVFQSENDDAGGLPPIDLTV
jgi:hypothetical protein